MRQRGQRVLSAVIGLTTVLTAACQAPRSSSGVRQAAPAGTAPDVDHEVAAVSRFRDIFRHVARSHGFDDKAVHQMIYLPPRPLLTPPDGALAAASGEELDGVLRAHAQKFTPTGTYQHGLDTPFGADVDVEQIFARQGPVTFVVIPGLLQEMLGQDPFQDAVEAGGAFKDQYQARIDQIDDSAFDLGEMGVVPTTLAGRVHLASLDDKAGKPRIQLIEMQAKFGSLETLGDVAGNAETFLRRLRLVLNALPAEACSRIYLMGYSRGSPVALEMASQLKDDAEHAAIYKNIKGIVSLGGVYYGTELVDNGAGLNAPYVGMIDTVKTTLAGMQAQPSRRLTRPAIRALLKRAAEQQLQHYLAQNDTAAFADEPQVDPAFVEDFVNKMSEIVFHDGLDLGANFARVQLFQFNVGSAILGLSTAARLDWWRNHTLPAGFEVYSLASSMPEKGAELNRTTIGRSPYYGPDTLDYRLFLRANADRFFDMTQVSLNDSQILEPKGRLWASLLTKYNPEQEPLRPYYMGIMGTHHWGIALRGIIRQTDGVLNPFPRTAMLETMGAFVLAPEG